MPCETHTRPNDSKTAQDATRALDNDSLGRKCFKDDAGRCGLNWDLCTTWPAWSRQPSIQALSDKYQKAVCAQTSTDCNNFHIRSKASSDSPAIRHFLMHNIGARCSELSAPRLSHSDAPWLRLRSSSGTAFKQGCLILCKFQESVLHHCANRRQLVERTVHSGRRASACRLALLLQVPAQAELERPPLLNLHVARRMAAPRGAPWRYAVTEIDATKLRQPHIDCSAASCRW